MDLGPLCGWFRNGRKKIASRPLVRRPLTWEALERLSRIGLVKPEKKDQARDARETQVPRLSFFVFFDFLRGLEEGWGFKGKPKRETHFFLYSFWRGFLHGRVSLFGFWSKTEITSENVTFCVQMWANEHLCHVSVGVVDLSMGGSTRSVPNLGNHGKNCMWQSPHLDGPRAGSAACSPFSTSQKWKCRTEVWVERRWFS